MFIISYILRTVTLFILILKFSQIWPLGAPLSRLVCLFNILPSLVNISFLSGSLKCSRLVLYSPAQAMELALFLSGALVPFGGKCYSEAKIWALGVLIVLGCHCCQILSVN